MGTRKDGDGKGGGPQFPLPHGGPDPAPVPASAASLPASAAPLPASPRTRARGTDGKATTGTRPSGTTNGAARGRNGDAKGTTNGAAKTTPHGKTQRLRPVAGTSDEPLKASLYSSGHRVAEFCRLVKRLERAIGIPVWMIVQGDNERGPWSGITTRIADELRRDLFRNADPQLAVLVHSPGGSATCAYQLGTAFAQRRNGFVCIVPRYAKSAATLMALGAQQIVLGRLGELGPLDAQIVNSDRDESMSALDEILSFEQLQRFALDTLDVTLLFLGAKTRKKVDAILPMAMQFVHGLVHPLFANIDAVRYTQLSRTLKVAEEYAVRLMSPRLGREKAIEIANRLIVAYPEHAFAIDFNEIKAIGLKVAEASGEASDILDEMVPMLNDVLAIGTVVPDIKVDDDGRAR